MSRRQLLRAWQGEVEKLNNLLSI